MELMDPLGFVLGVVLGLGGGDCVDRSPTLSAIPLNPDADVVPSDVCTFRLAGGRPEGGGALFLDLNRNAIVGHFPPSTGEGVGHAVQATRFMRHHLERQINCNAAVRAGQDRLRRICRACWGQTMGLVQALSILCQTTKGE